ncbi:MAG TPA: peptidoglycan-binding domain-containing protein [Candidatus Binatia bacterium]|jgi:peptidoglycan hydrolase-like protein with peptidoglycan-binding domain
MKKRNSMMTAMLLSGAVSLVASPAWSQKASNETAHQVRPGSAQSIPRGSEPGTPQISKNDMRAVEQALQAKGYKVGKTDGIVDKETRSAIRAFQKDKGLTITGMVDQETANQLGVKLSSKSSGSTHSPSGMSSKTKPGDEQAISPGTRR